MATNRNEDADKPPLWVSPAFGRTVLLLVLFGLTVSLLFVSEPSGQNALEIGKPSTETVKAPVSISIVDVDETKRLKRRARARVEKVFRHDPKVETKAIDSARQFFASVDTVGPQSDLGAAREQLKTDWNKVDGEAIDKALTLSAADLASTERSAVEIMRALFRDRVTEENLADLRESVDRLLVGIRETDKPVVRETVVAFVRPNYVLDERETAARRNEAAAKIDPVRLTRVEGETVVGEGEVVTPSQGRILDELGLLKDDFGFRRLIGICLITAAVFAVFGAYLWRFQRKVFADPRLIGLVGIMIVAVIGAAKLLNVFPSVYLTPVIAVSMITTILFGGQLGMAAVLIAGFLTSIVVENQLVFLSMAVLGGVFAAYFSNNVSKRETLVRAGLWISLGSAYAVFAASLITDNLLSVALVNSGWGLVGGLFSTVLAIGTLPFLESSFNITTDLKLLELSNPNQPLLRELMTRAPGTYTHSIYAGSIAEAGARAIGANPILARVGAYYHDVGKAKRALFFSENQIGIDNPHDRTQPHLSYLIIAAHVRDGAEMARKANLPPEIVDIVEQHHGTSVVAYFFHRAQRRQRKEKVSEVDFRYTGGRPKSKEAALVMLADSAEAMARSLSKPSPSRLDHLVRKAIQTRLTDGQLSLSSLTLADLEKIGDAFAVALGSIYHTRVAYPDASGVKATPSKAETGKGKVVPFERKGYGDTDK